MKEEKTYKVYTHRVVTDDNGPMYYVGITCQNLPHRWRPSSYITTTLKPYIDKYGWENIEHSVFADGLDREMALKLEDTLIQMYRHFDCCINYYRSGLICKGNNTKYQLQYYYDHHRNDPEYMERMRQRSRKYYRDKYANDPEWLERERERNRERMRKKRAENKQKQLQQNDDL